MRCHGLSSLARVHDGAGEPVLKPRRILLHGCVPCPTARGPISRRNGAGCGALKCPATRATHSLSERSPMGYRRRSMAASMPGHGGCSRKPSNPMASRLERHRAGSAKARSSSASGTVSCTRCSCKGFAWRDETYPSLSAITGTNWNGWAFFGLKRRTKEEPTNG